MGDLPETNIAGVTSGSVQTNGVRLHVATAGPNDGPLVILLHGFPDFWYVWRRQIPFLVQRGYRVWAPDQRGYNSSDKPWGLAAYKLDELAADVGGLIDAAGVERAHVVGHDWGGLVAWWLALTQPTRLNKLAILNAPHPAVLLRNAGHNPAQMIRSWYFLLFQPPGLAETLLSMGNWRSLELMLHIMSGPGTYTQADFVLYRRAWSQPRAMTSMLNWYRALVQRRPRFPADLRVDVPTQIIWGRNDMAMLPELARQSLEWCDQGRLEYLETSHWVMLDAPDRVNVLLGEFLG